MGNVIEWTYCAEGITYEREHGDVEVIICLTEKTESYVNGITYPKIKFERARFMPYNKGRSNINIDYHKCVYLISKERMNLFLDRAWLNVKPDFEKIEVPVTYIEDMFDFDEDEKEKKVKKRKVKSNA